MLIDDQPKASARTKPLEAVIETIRRRLPDGRSVPGWWSGRAARPMRSAGMGENGVVSDITADAVSGDILDER